MKSSLRSLCYSVSFLAVLMFAQLSTAQEAAASIPITMSFPGGPSNFTASVSGTVTVEKAMQVAGIKYTATNFSQSLGYALMLFFPSPNSPFPASTNGNFGSTFWWLCVNGRSANQGMSFQPVSAGDKILWLWTNRAVCPNDNADAQSKAGHKKPTTPQKID